ncbi:hypothetical protein PAECIP111892_02324 [Paenibacillus auburnensis]|uniref:Uncharacterized protein n=1 Tax=Paenibacillus auburnensis TaxID=2905649 RepID=A0ABN8G1B7_9BACL|nr:hypothetical protein [Paenibacillus auburnensis]CAH1196780.1 hypothetical protein PAECIP111892_02324 [Paenibacillus auburnensis]
MTRRIQAYFRTESEAEGAKTALIPYGVEGLEISPLTDPLDIGRNNRPNILLPLVPYNNSAMTGGAFGVAGTAGTLNGAAIVPAVDPDDGLERSDINNDDGLRRNADVNHDVDLSDVTVVMALKVAEEHYNEVIETLRGKHAYVEVFE